MYTAIPLTNMKHEPPTHYLIIDSDLIGNNISKSAASTIIHSSNEADVHSRRSKASPQRCKKKSFDESQPAIFLFLLLLFVSHNSGTLRRNANKRSPFPSLPPSRPIQAITVGRTFTSMRAKICVLMLLPLK